VSALPLSPMELEPLFRPGECVANAEEFAQAVIRVQDRHHELRRYLNALRRAKRNDGIEDAAKCSSSVLYQGGSSLNKYERALIKLTNQIKRNIELYPYWLAAPRKKKELGAK
jgi:hypothetical protein